MVCYACAFMRYWAGKQTDQDKVHLLTGVAAFQAEALRHHEDQVRMDTGRIQDTSDGGSTSTEDSEKKQAGGV